MNLYEYEGKQLFKQFNIAIPKGMVIRRGDILPDVFTDLGVAEVVVKAQVLSGKRGKNNGIRFCSTQEEVVAAAQDLFAMEVRGQYVAAVRIEEKLDIAQEHYLSITYDTNKKQPVLVYSAEGGVDIEDVGEGKIVKQLLDIRNIVIPTESEGRVEESLAVNNKNDVSEERDPSTSLRFTRDDSELFAIVQQLWTCFLDSDTRVVEINPLVKTTDGKWIAADAKVAIDDDAFFRHTSVDSVQAFDWTELEPRTMLGRQPTEREVAVVEIDKGEKYYQGTAGKYIEMEGSIAVLFSGGGASIANMDALEQNGLQAANYTEYSGNPPREKVAALAKIVLSKPGLEGLWIAGGVANFTNVEATFRGIVDALDEVKPTYPIVIRRAGPFDIEGMKLMQDCAERNGLNMKLFGKEVSMDETAKTLAEEINNI